MSALLRLADDQVHVLRHYHIAKQLESVPRAKLPEYLHKTITRTSRSQAGPAAIAAKRDEVQIATPVMPLQGIAHGRKFQLAEKSKPAPLHSKGCGTHVYIHCLQRVVRE